MTFWFFLVCRNFCMTKRSFLRMEIGGRQRLQRIWGRRASTAEYWSENAFCLILKETFSFASVTNKDASAFALLLHLYFLSSYRWQNQIWLCFRFELDRAVNGLWYDSMVLLLSVSVGQVSNKKLLISEENINDVKYREIQG